MYSDVPIISLNLDRDFFDPEQGTHPAKSELELLGRDRNYKIPVKRLSGADASFVRLILNGRGASANHEHPGDELMLVIDGQIEVRFDGSGVRTSMNSGDIIHFYAEQRHQVLNLGAKRAEIFIVRFYQCGLPRSTDTRQDVWRAVDTLLTGAAAATQTDQSPAPKIQLWNHARRWIRESIPHYASTAPSRDHLGLSRFLQEWQRLKPNGLESVSALKALGDVSPEILARYEWKELVELLSQLTGIGHYLLEGFACPSIPNVVFIRHNDYRVHEAHGAGGGVSYHLPIRNLSCSDISIAQVTLAPTSEGPMNAHPGLEAILCLQGTLLVIDDGVPQTEVGPRGLCHFDSSLTHRVANTSPTNAAVFLVIRFYRDGQLSRVKAD